MAKVKQRVLPQITLDESDSDDSAMFDELAGKPEERTVLMLDPSLIDPSPQQARTEFDSDDIAAFANVMREVGFTSTIWIRPNPKVPRRYLLIYGERRLKAAKLVVQDSHPKFTKIPCEVRADIIDPEVLEFLGFFENSQRKDLPAYDEAVYYRKLLDRRNAQGKTVYTIEKLAARAHVTENHIRDRLFLLDLPEDALDAYKQNPHMALRSLREICRLENPGQRAPWLTLLIQNDISREELRKSVQAMLDENSKSVEEAVSSHESNAEPSTVNAPSLQTAAATETSAIPQKANAGTAEVISQKETGTRTQENPPTYSAAVPQEEYRKGQIKSYRTMVSRDMQNLQTIVNRWVGFMKQEDEEIAEIFQDGMRKATELILNAQQQMTEQDDARRH